MADTITVKRRETTGSRASQRLRAGGQIPVVLYGHKEDAVSLATCEKELMKVLAHKTKVLNLDGEASGQAMVQALQWDTFHRDLLHVDLLRVDATERVQTSVPVELKGESIGAREGGMVEQTLMSVEIEASATNLPDVLHLVIDEMHLGESLTAGQIADLPSGAKLVTDPGTVIVHCVKPAGEPDLDAVAEGADSPEVIAKGGEKEEESKSDE